MTGYDPDFLTESVPLPTFSPTLDGDVLRRPDLRHDVFADYVHYTVAMHRGFRTPLFAALNVDQTQHRKAPRRDRWRIDSRIGREHQLDNAYYHRNPWDRGHLARRATAAWGETLQAATRASDETFYFSNASLQHANFNQDEWLALEEWAFDLDLDKDDRFSVFSGPVFGDFMRTIRPDEREAAFVPAAFFKVLFFMNKSDALEVRAFLIPQDEKAIRDKGGRRIFDHQTYQVAVADIEQMTGLDFPEVLPGRNPLFFVDRPEVRDNNNVTDFPERREVSGPADIVRDNARPRDITFADDTVDVFIAAAMVNPAGPEREGEWVSILNLAAEAQSIDGWKLVDDQRRTKVLSGTIGPGEAIRVQPLSPVILANNRTAFIQLLNDRNQQIDRVPYTKEQAMRQGKPVIFAYRDLDYDQPHRDDRLDRDAIED